MNNLSRAHQPSHLEFPRFRESICSPGTPSDDYYPTRKQTDLLEFRKRGRGNILAACRERGVGPGSEERARRDAVASMFLVRKVDGTLSLDADDNLITTAVSISDVSPLCR